MKIEEKIERGGDGARLRRRSDGAGAAGNQDGGRQPGLRLQHLLLQLLFLSQLQQLMHFQLWLMNDRFP